MNQKSFAMQLAAAALTGGIATAFAAALAPHFTAGFRLAVDVLLAGLVPYLVYALVLPYLRGWRLSLPLLVIFVVHLVVVVVARSNGGYDSDRSLFIQLPLGLAMLALLVVILTLRGNPMHKP